MTFETAKEAIDHVEWAMSISDDYLLKGKITPVDSTLLNKLSGIKGLSSLACRLFMNKLSSKVGTRYLEVGTHTGSSLISSCFGNKINRAVAIDNWSMDENSKPQLMKYLEFFKDDFFKEPELIEAEAFSMDKSKLGQFDVYFYDGHHSADSQEKGLTCFWDNLAPVSIVIIDDYALVRTQQGTVRALDKLGCKQHLRYAWTLPGGEGFEHLYWGGLAVMVFAK
jgi:precorrin-6B methylase 2